MARIQSRKASTIEALTNTVASLGVFLGFGLPLDLVIGLTFGMLIKNLLVRRVFAAVTRRWGL